MNIFDRIEALTGLTPNEEALIQYIQKEPERFLNLKPRQIAKEAYVSLSTIYRFADKLELDGINAFKVELAAALKAERKEEIPVLDRQRILENSPVQDLQRISEVMQLSLRQTSLSVSPQELRKIQDLLQKAESITVFCSYSNLFFARNFQHQMQEIGQFIRVPEDGYSKRVCVERMHKGDVGIIFSMDGYSSTMFKMAEIMNTNGSPYILVTRNPKNILLENAAAVFMLNPAESFYDDIGDFSIRVSVLYAFDMLFTLVFKSSFESNEKLKIEPLSDLAGKRVDLDADAFDDPKQ